MVMVPVCACSLVLETQLGVKFPHRVVVIVGVDRIY